MSLSVIGVNHHQTVEFREKLAFAAEDIPSALQQLTEDGEISGSVILSTCNRVEIYFYSESPFAYKRVLDLLSIHSNVEHSEIETNTYHYTHEDAIRHLLKVCCGVDSIVLGEPQILEQAKLAYQRAKDSGCAGSILGHIFERTFAIAKRLRTETEISNGSVSTSKAAVDLVRQQLGSLADKRVLIIGAGKIATLAAKYFDHYGVGEMVIVNRTLARAEAVASLFQAKALPLSELKTALHEADIVVSCTSAESFVITREMLAEIFAETCQDRVLVDLAVPRDIDPEVRELPQVQLFDVDVLDNVTDANREQRRLAAKEIEARIEDEVQKCLYHIHSRKIGPVIQSLKIKAEEIRTDTLERNDRQLQGLSKKQRATVDYLTKAIVNKLLHNPIMLLKQQVDMSPDQMQVIQQMFDLEMEADS